MMMRKATVLLPLLAGAAVVTAGCAASATADPAGASSSSAAPSSSAVATIAAEPTKSESIKDAQWRLQSDPTAWFRVQGSNISGNDSCNALSGTATASSADRVDFGAGLAATRKYCPDPKGTQTAIAEALKGERVWQRAGAQLVLTDPENNRSWTFVLTASASAAPSAANPSASNPAAAPSALTPSVSTAPTA